MGESKKTSKHHFLEISAEEALFGPISEETRLQGMIAVFHENERPLQGLAGLLDWRFQGALSSYLRNGIISGKEGEIAYLPVRHPVGTGGRTYHLILVGAGHSPSPGERQAIDGKTASSLSDKIGSLKIPRLGVSRADFGNVPKEFLSQQMKEAPLWIVQ